MAITGSVLTLGSVQVDGRRYVVETHSDSQGVCAVIEYLAAIGADYNAIMADRAIALNSSLADQEARSKVQADTNPTPFRFQTGLQFLNRLRAFYQQATQLQCAYLANWILNRIADGSVTDAQLQNAFNLTSGQYTALKGRWTTLQTGYLSVQSAVGE